MHFADVWKCALMGWFRISLVKPVRGMIARSFMATLRLFDIETGSEAPLSPHAF